METIKFIRKITALIVISILWLSCFSCGDYIRNELEKERIFDEKTYNALPDTMTILCDSYDLCGRTFEQFTSQKFPGYMPIKKLPVGIDRKRMYYELTIVRKKTG